MPTPATTHASKFSSRGTSYSAKYSTRSTSHASKFIAGVDTFLLQDDTYFLLLESGFKILLTSPTRHSPKFS